VGKVIFAEEMLQFGSFFHQTGGSAHTATRILGGNHVGYGFDQPAIVCRFNDTLGAWQVVVEELCIGKGATDVCEKGHQFRVIERTPGW
jgi:hypothetical protein